MSAKQYAMEGFLAILMVLGIFGNVNVIVAVARKKVLRTKGAMLVFVLAISHLVCNLSELKVLLQRVRFQKMKGRDCFEQNIPYSFAVMFQSGLFLSMSLDLCFCIMFPIKHMLWPKTKYVLIMCILPTIFSVAMCIVNFLFITDEYAPYCAFMLTMDDGVYELVSSAVVICNIATLAISIVSVLVAVKKSQDMRNHRHSQNSRRSSTCEERRKVFRSTFYMMAFYIICWMTSSVIAKTLLIIFGDEKKLLEYLPYLMIITMPNFCQAFFVTYFRSPRFRKAYKEHFHKLTCGCLFSDVFDMPDPRFGESGSRHDSATNPQAPTEVDVKPKENQKEYQKKTVRILEAEAI